MRLLTLTAGILLASLITLAATQEQRPEPSGGYSGGPGIGADAAGATWYFTCRHTDDRHRHWGEGKTHLFYFRGQDSQSGNHYHFVRWATFDWGLERITADDRKTYNCTGAHT